MLRVPIQSKKKNGFQYQVLILDFKHKVDCRLKTSRLITTSQSKKVNSTDDRNARHLKKSIATTKGKGYV